MIQWVNTDINFDLPYCCLVVSHRALMTSTSRLDIIQLLKDAGENMTLVEAAVKDLIEEIRPEWGGGVLHGIRMSGFHSEWEFLYLHPNLPRSKDGYPPTKVRLMPNESYAEDGHVVVTELPHLPLPVAHSGWQFQRPEPSVHSEVADRVVRKMAEMVERRITEKSQGHVVQGARPATPEEFKKGFSQARPADEAPEL